jgi:hypothetical protein
MVLASFEHVDRVEQGDDISASSTRGAERTQAGPASGLE